MTVITCDICGDKAVCFRINMGLIPKMQTISIVTDVITWREPPSIDLCEKHLKEAKSKIKDLENEILSKKKPEETSLERISYV